MKRVTLEIEDDYATLLTFSVIGVMRDSTNVHTWSTKVEDGKVLRQVGC